MAATKTSLRSLARRWRQLQAELARLDLQLQTLVTSVAPTLVALPGVGIDTAGQLLVSAGDNPQRLRSEAAFAHLCGTAPSRHPRAVPTATGSIAAVTAERTMPCGASPWSGCAATHPPGAYVERRTEQGLSKLDIMRCLKRYIAREVYHHLTSPPSTAPTACPK